MSLPNPSLPISWGEFVDKLTILEIKFARLTSSGALANVQRELSALQEFWDRSGIGQTGAPALKAALRKVNEELWQIEDRIRAKEALQSFDDEFIELARSVYRTNDARAALKREINLLLQSELMEEKEYHRY